MKAGLRLAWASFVCLCACAGPPAVVASVPTGDASAAASASVAPVDPPAPVADAAPSAPAPPPPAPDGCHAGRPPLNAPGWFVFVGEFVSSRDDDESGYAHGLRSYSFKPLQAWHGIASGDEISGVFFLPNASDPAPHSKPPRFRRGEQALVVIDRGGMSGKMSIIAEAIPREAAKARIDALGAPCWTR